MTLSVLPPDWRDWVVDCVRKGCDHNQTLQILIENNMGQEQSIAAIKEAIALCQSESPITTQEVARPFVDVEQNKITLSDGQVVRVVSCLKSPTVVVLDHVLTEQECDQMITLAQEKLAISRVVDNNTGAEVLDDHRKSRGCSFKIGEFEINRVIEQRLSELIHWPIINGEGLQVLRYDIGGEYRPHYDYFDPALPGSQRHLQSGGQRFGTVILYLSDVEKGGSTFLPNVHFEAKPKKGSALFFCNVDPLGRIDPRTLHAGCPVEEGVKYIATKWVRQNEYV